MVASHRGKDLKDFRKYLITVLKIAGSLAIIGYLFYSAINTPDGRTALVGILAQYKSWSIGFLAVGFSVLFLAILTTMVRWCYLVRALGIDLSLRDALRIGFVGYLFNLAPLGIVGGDLLKAWMLAREKPGDRSDKPSNRAKAFASVIVDRIVGLYVLLLFAAMGLLITGIFHRRPLVCIAVWAVAAVSTAGIALILVPGFLEGLDKRLVSTNARLAKVRHGVKSLSDALKIYRGERRVLFWACLATIPVHSLLTASIFFTSLGLRFDKVPFRDYFAVYPVSSILSTIPLPAGPQEFGIVSLYKTVRVRAEESNGSDYAALTAAEKAAQQKTWHLEGLILALIYRLSTILIAPIGAAYYFLGARSEVSEVLHHHEDDDVSAPD